jgi:hypothetical protein
MKSSTPRRSPVPSAMGPVAKIQNDRADEHDTEHLSNTRDRGMIHLAKVVIDRRTSD